jgi:hypothetical protein
MRQGAQAKRLQFSELQWKRIHDSLECTIVDPRIRSDLEWIAKHFRTTIQSPKQIKSEKKDFLSLAKQAKLLLPIFDRLSNTTSMHILFAASPHLPAPPQGRRWDEKEIKRIIFQFRNELENLVSLSYVFGAPGHRVPANVDVHRNQSWEAAMSVYEGLTGRRAGVSKPSNSAACRSPAGGPFVRFIQAFTAAVPGEKEPTGDQVHAWRQRCPNR